MCFSQSKIGLLLLSLPFLISAGCYTPGEISKREILQSGEISYYLIHSTDSSWLLVNCSVADGILTGMKVAEKIKPKKAKTIDLYVAPDDVVRVDGNIVSVPIGNIAKAETEKINKVRTFESLVLAVMAAIPAIFIIALAIGGGYDM